MNVVDNTYSKIAQKVYIDVDYSFRPLHLMGKRYDYFPNNDFEELFIRVYFHLLELANGLKINGKR